jgi:hypothetical protein
MPGEGRIVRAPGLPLFGAGLIGFRDTDEKRDVVTNEREKDVDVMRPPGAALSHEVAKGEAVEAEIDAFISRRHKHRCKSEAERELGAAWKASERRQEAATRREARAGWYGRHMHRAELYGRLSREHAAPAEGLLVPTKEGGESEELAKMDEYRDAKAKIQADADLTYEVRGSRVQALDLKHTGRRRPAQEPGAPMGAGEGAVADGPMPRN